MQFFWQVHEKKQFQSRTNTTCMPLRFENYLRGTHHFAMIRLSGTIFNPSEVNWCSVIVTVDQTKMCQKPHQHFSEQMKHNKMTMDGHGLSANLFVAKGMHPALLTCWGYHKICPTKWPTSRCDVATFDKLNFQCRKNIKHGNIYIYKILYPAANHA